MRRAGGRQLALTDRVRPGPRVPLIRLVTPSQFERKQLKLALGAYLIRQLAQIIRTSPQSWLDAGQILFLLPRPTLFPFS